MQVFILSPVNCNATNWCSVLTTHLDRDYLPKPDSLIGPYRKSTYSLCFYITLNGTSLESCTRTGIAHDNLHAGKPVICTNKIITRSKKSFSSFSGN
jgi:hypothetical protein